MFRHSSLYWATFILLTDVLNLLGGSSLNASRDLRGHIRQTSAIVDSLHVSLSFIVRVVVVLQDDRVRPHRANTITAHHIVQGAAVQCILISH